MPVKCILIVRAGKDVMQRSFLHSEAPPTNVRAVRSLLQANDLRLETLPFDFVVSSPQVKSGKAVSLRTDREVIAFFAQVDHLAGEVTFDVTVTSDAEVSQNLTSKFMDDDIVTLLVFPPLSASEGAPRESAPPGQCRKEKGTAAAADVVEKTFIIPAVGVVAALRRAVASTLNSENTLIDYAPRISLFNVVDRTSAPEPITDDRAARHLLQHHAKAGTSVKITFTVATRSAASRSESHRSSDPPTPPLSGVTKSPLPALSPTAAGVPIPSPPTSPSLPRSPSRHNTTAAVRLKTSDGPEGDERAFTFAFDKKESALLDRFRAVCVQERNGAGPHHAANLPGTEVAVIVGGARHVLRTDGDLREWMALAKESCQPLRVTLQHIKAAVPTVATTAPPASAAPMPPVRDAHRSVSPPTDATASAAEEAANGSHDAPALKSSLVEKVTTTTLWRKSPLLAAPHEPAKVEGTPPLPNVKVPATAAPSPRENGSAAPRSPVGAAAARVLNVQGTQEVSVDDKQRGGANGLEHRFSPPLSTRQATLPSAAMPMPVPLTQGYEAVPGEVTTSRPSLPELLPQHLHPAPLLPTLSASASAEVSEAHERSAGSTPFQQSLSAMVAKGTAGDQPGVPKLLSAAASGSIVISATEVQLPRIKPRSARTRSFSSRATTPRGKAAGDVSSTASTITATPTAKRTGDTVANSARHDSRGGTQREAAAVPSATPRGINKEGTAGSPGSVSPRVAEEPQLCKGGAEATARSPTSPTSPRQLAATGTRVSSPPCVQVTLTPAAKRASHEAPAFSSPKSPCIVTVLEASGAASGVARQPTQEPRFFQVFVRLVEPPLREHREALVFCRPCCDDEATWNHLADTILRTFGLAPPQGRSAASLLSFRFHAVADDCSGIVTDVINDFRQLAERLASAALSTSMLEVELMETRAARTPAAGPLPLGPPPPRDRLDAFSWIDAFADRVLAGLCGERVDVRSVSWSDVDNLLRRDAKKGDAPSQPGEGSVVTSEGFRRAFRDALRAHPRLVLEALVTAVVSGNVQPFPGNFDVSHRSLSAADIHAEERRLQEDIEATLNGLSAQDVEAFIQDSVCGGASDDRVVLCSLLGALLAATPCPSYLNWLNDHFRGKLSGILFAKMRAYQGASVQDSPIPIGVLYACCWEVLKLSLADESVPGAVTTTAGRVRRWCLAAVRLECLRRHVVFPPLPPFGSVRDAARPISAGSLAVAASMLLSSASREAAGASAPADEGSPPAGKAPHPSTPRSETAGRRGSGHAHPSVAKDGRHKAGGPATRSGAYGQREKRSSKVQYRYRYQCTGPGTGAADGGASPRE